MSETTKEQESKTPKAKKPEASKVEQKPASSTKRETQDVTCKPVSGKKEFTLRKGSVLHGIYRCFELKDGATKEEMLERLIKEFPERKPEHLASTIQTQIHRMPKEKGFELGRDEKGHYGVHIEGRATNRVLSPEAQLKADARRAEKEKAEAEAEKEKAKAKAAKEAQKAKEDAEKAEAKAKAEKEAAEKAAREAKAKADAAAKAAQAMKKA